MQDQLGSVTYDESYVREVRAQWEPSEIRPLCSLSCRLDCRPCQSEVHGQ